ncbi:MAG: DJ-1/PfpI family protein [Candidatus Promineifilaceae bacterium]
MEYSVGIVIYGGFSLLDLAGPYEILGRAVDPGDRDQQLFAQFAVGRNKDLITCQGGIQILPQHIYPDAHIYNVLLVPGGPGCLEATRNLRLMNWLERAARLAKVVAAVGSGTFILAASRLLDNQKVANVSGLSEAYPAVQTERVEGVVKDGNILSVSTNDYGSELGMAIIAELLGSDHAEIALGG